MMLTMSELIHPTVILDPQAEIAPDVQIGPYSIIEGPVRIGPGCVIEGHVALSGPLEMGRDNFVGHGAVLGKSPQHKGYQGEQTWLRIGDGNVFREQVTVHRGTEQGGGETRIGDRNLFMVGSHLGHDCRVGDGCTLINGALVAGHVVLQDHCILSGHSAVQQRVRIGRLAMIGGLGSTTKDIPPFLLHQGYNCTSHLNLVGLRRAGFPVATINSLREAFRILFKEGRPLNCALDRIEADLGTVAEVNEFVGFIRESTLGINPARGNDRKHRSY
ncbi:acyl-ACP--UDP-N-acetylglucosamine O-acyltransferase [Singulisphaera acidiphila]|uniref:Acyl-(Acyl-carrier-protein)--UDP-N-acetylglucosamine O-acyltransferase n=1 Tax=Singulisphaera acidiphila (strain ATCC BAA-1392 / DSM 18658 / VKM B-2454 / MOB10) TaxID=886293 RepID=L0DF09_SINAD|nr:acyl-ACP--UDP-N-acetylglucosamine O-acyltransferase [Singulisphaera acidiphila]AGA27959.1 acyl-(acyl-carrier-protein)--UDP-N-acetylglucosamine O-acyltransferase [Singulisphaera acidiphila DSM 18658]